MPTGQAIVNGALTALGILEQGGTPSVSDSTDTLNELNVMWDGLSIDEDWIYAVLSNSYSLSANVPSYTIGVGAAFNQQRPSRIYHAHILTTVGASQIRRELGIVDRMKYDAHGDLSAAAAIADELYPDFNVDANGYATLYFFPVPTVPVPQKVELDFGVPFTAWALGTNYNIPAGYQDAIQYLLAWRCLPRYGAIVSQQQAEVVRELGLKAEQRITAANVINRQRIVQPPLAPPPQPAGPSPITTQAMAGFQGMQPKML